MSELLEKIAVAIDKNTDPTRCPFQPKAKQTNKPNATPMEENDTFNDSGVLTDSLQVATALPAAKFPHVALDFRDFKKKGPRLGENVSVDANAHHVVPGHGSLPESSVCKFMGDKPNMPEKCSKQSKIVMGGGGINYDVNDARNGRWLASNNALRSNWDGDYQAEYAFLAINRTGAQFHDAHTDYNQFIARRLEELYTKIQSHIQDCDLKPCIDKQDGGQFDRPPFPYLRTRLYGVSERVTGYLSLGKLKWWCEPEITTSRFNPLYYRIAKGEITAPDTFAADGKKPVVITDHAIAAAQDRSLTVTAR